MEKEYNIIDKFFEYREEIFLENADKDKCVLENKIKDINRDSINKVLDTIPNENKELKEKLQSSIDNLVADYNVILAYYNKKYYKQGFSDASILNKILDV